MLQVYRNSLPKTVSHSLAELTWVYSLGLFSQRSPCLARNALYGKGREMGRVKGSLDMQAEKSTLCSRGHLKYKIATGVAREVAKQHRGETSSHKLCKVVVYTLII